MTVECAIPQRYHRAIMGPKGSRIQQITREHEVQIKFPERDETAGASICHQPAPLVSMVTTAVMWSPLFEFKKLTTLLLPWLRAQGRTPRHRRMETPAQRQSLSRVRVTSSPSVDDQRSVRWHGQPCWYAHFYLSALFLQSFPGCLSSCAPLAFLIFVLFVTSLIISATSNPPFLCLISFLSPVPLLIHCSSPSSLPFLFFSSLIPRCPFISFPCSPGFGPCHRGRGSFLRSPSLYHWAEGQWDPQDDGGI